MSAPPAAVLRIATRKSQLALWQAEHVAALLRRAHGGLEVELVPMVTQGDRIQDRSLAAIGGKELFIKELEVALEERRADIAVHSMKDLPGDLPQGLIIAAVLERADPRDALLTTAATGAVVGGQTGLAHTNPARQCGYTAAAPPGRRHGCHRARLRRSDSAGIG